jgi:membrane-bound lytic murein transglycosylase D
LIAAALTCAAQSSRADLLLPMVTPVVAPAVSAASDTTQSSVASPLAAARAAYQSAWTQRQAGEFQAAVRVLDEALPAIATALEGDLDATTRRDLIEMQGKLTGLRSAAQHDVVDPTTPRGSRAEDAADAQVLNAPALEDIEPQKNADVDKWIEFFSGTGRSVFERWLKRSGRYMELFRSVLKKEGLPPDLVHLVFVESGFNLNARSISAAVGPWQFLRSTGRLFGLTVNQWVDERKDPEKSTVAAARYLKHLYSIFGDWPLALASYNAGEGTVLRAIKRQGTTNYWDLRLPRQTEEYVPQFMAVLAISREPRKYGFDEVELDEPMDFDEVAFKGTVDLRAIAKLAECSYEEIRLLNPAVLRHAAPANDGVTTIRVPSGKASLVLSKLEEGAQLPAVNLSVKHKVRRGETLQGIANQYHVSATQLAHANRVSRARPLMRGMMLTVPASFTPPAPAALEPGDPRRSTGYVPSRKFGTPAQLDGESDAEGRLTVTVHEGETLGMIAARHGVSVADVVRWNHLKSSTVRRGTRLKLRTGDAAIASAESLAADSVKVAALKPPSARRGAKAPRGPARAVVVVRAGETLGQIASRHGVSLTSLKRANGLSTSRIHAGQRLRIPA